MYLDVEHYLGVYSLRKRMQEEGITKPSEQMKKFTMSAIGLSLMIGSAFAVTPPQAAVNTVKPPVKKSVRTAHKPGHVVTSAANPKPVVVK